MIHGDTPADLGESDPPHIKNWFSSYEYESFVLETNDNLGFSEHQGSQGFESECNNTGNLLKSLEKSSKELVTNGKNESVLIKCNRSEEENKCRKEVFESQDSPLFSPEPPPDIENWFSSYVYESPEVDTIDDLIVSDNKETMVDCSESMADCNEKMKEFEKDESLCVTPDDLICKQTSECDNDSTKEDENPTDLPKDNSHANSFENGSKKVEEAGNGFVSIKSKKENHEKSKQVNGVDQQRYVFKSVNNMKKKKKKKGDERVTLGDVTNIVDEHSSVTGKWKCPRKRKPDIGPPLKQLRLGQWFRHV